MFFVFICVCTLQSVIKKAQRCCTNQYFIRFFFRFFELTSRVFCYVLIWLVLGDVVFAVILLLHLCHNLLLFYGGCLGRQLYNVFGYLIYIPQLNRTLQEGDQPFKCLKNFFYIRWYRNATTMQTNMIILRSIEVILFAIILLAYNFTSNLEYHNSTIVSVIYIICFSFSLLMPLFWFLIEKAKIIDIKRNKEEVALENIFQAIKLNRLLAIKTQFNSKSHVTNCISTNESDTKQTPLNYAMARNASDIVAWMIHESGFLTEIEINSVDKYGQTPFFIGCKYGSLESIKILKQGTFHCESTKRNMFEHSALYVACKYGRDHIVRYLLHQLVNIGIEDMINNQVSLDDETRDGGSNEGNTPLHIACKRGHYKCVSLLLDTVYVDINRINKENDAAIHLAVLNRFHKIAQKLIDNPKFHLSDDNLDKLWYYSIKFDAVNIVQRLLAMYGIRNNNNANNSENMAKKVFDILAPCRVYKGTGMRRNELRRQKALEMQKEQEKEKAIEKNSDKNDKKKAKRSKPKGKSSKVPANPNLKRAQSSEDEKNEFDEDWGVLERKKTTVGRHVKQASILSDIAADHTPLFVAARYDAGNVLELIGRVCRGNALFDVNSINSEGLSPLFIACMRSNEAAMNALLNCDNIDVMIRCGVIRNSIVNAACIGGSWEILRTIARRIESDFGQKKLRRELTRPNSGGETAMYIACEHDSYEIVRNLLVTYDYINDTKERKADNGKTAKDIAAEKGNKMTVQELRLFEKFEVDI